MTQEDFYQIESSQRQHNEELRKEAERMDMYTINQLRIISALKCRVFKDGDMYCCLYGEDLQEGIAGFGETPYQAIIEFNKELGIL